MTVTNQPFPNIATPFVTLNNGNISQAWLQFLITLWNRTGASNGLINVPSGAIAAYGGTNPPNGWFLCDGSAVSRTTYASLFTAIGVIWGAGDGATTFNLPNLQDRFLLGEGILHPLASEGGSSDISLSVANLASHSHTLTDPGHTHAFTGTAHGHTVADPTHTHGITDPGHHHTSAATASNAATGSSGVGSVAGNTGTSTTGVTVNPALTGITVDNTTAGGTNSTNTTGITANDTGSGTAFSILPPFATVVYMIKS
jgi:microcystin-dependent protein